jgi:nicotinate-nucleotide pyrophosphorylase (carboxylating)
MRKKVQEFLVEDVGSGDITSQLVVPENAKARGRIVCKEDCILAGVEEASMVFEELGAKVYRSEKDGSPAKKGDVVLEVQGSAKALLAGERVALNLIMRMSGIATVTHALTARCRKLNPKVRIAATRKTTPGFRDFEKKAVVLGGGFPHRYGLYDEILVKDNHIAIAGGIEEALRSAKRSGKKVEIEVQTPEEAKTALKHGADIIMLDNFSPDEALRTSVELRKLNPGIVIEISGGIKPDTIEKYALAADIISLGWLTHSYKSIDFSMDIEKA